MAARRTAKKTKSARKPARRKKRSTKKARTGSPKPVTVPRKYRSGFKLRDEVVEEALSTGDHRDLLEAYFGESGYAELVALTRQARTRAVRGRERVLILPGIMGSKLGRAGRIFDDTLWIDPIDVARGNLADLALNGEDIVPLGVILLAYLKLKLSLQIRGFDAAFHPYDWRTDLPHLGRELRSRILREARGSSHLSIVAHSMGGLVARAALAQLGQRADKVHRLVMLGTPNFGSFVPVQAFRGVYPLVRKVAAIDRRHDAEELAVKVFRTFPGLYQMLPFREKFSAVDLYDPRAWPERGPQPLDGILRAAPTAQAALAPASDRMVVIAGVGQATTTGVAVRDDEFEYAVSQAGDGTVPLEFAQLPNVGHTYYVEESHGSLPNNPNVGRAVGDILETGETSALADSWSPRRAAPWRVRESDIEDDPFEGKDRGQLGAREYRHLLEEVAAPPERGPEAVLPTGGALLVHGTSAEPIVVGRRRQHRLDIYLAHGSITQVSTRAIVLGLFQDVAPTGAAQAIDAALDGAITEFTTRRMFNGKVGEVFLLPAGQQRIRADLVGFVGLGGFDTFNEEVLRLAAENLVRTLTRTNVHDFATVLIGSGSAINVRDSLRCLAEGAFQGIKDVGARSRLRSVTLCELDAARYQAMKSELLALSTTALFDDVEVTLEEVELPPEPDMPAVTRARLIEPGPEPVYLITRQEEVSARRAVYRASALTAGGKATVVSDLIEVSQRALADHLEVIETDRFDYAGLKAFGSQLGQLVLPESVAAVLKKMSKDPLIVIHDAATSRIPWETLCIGDWFPAAGSGLSRKYAADNLSVAKWLDERRLDKVLDVLLIVNPTEDLDGAEAEGERVRQQFAGDARVRIRELRRQEATWTAVRAAFRSGEFDVVHYAGHAEFVPSDRKRSGIVCHGDRVLSGANLAGLSNLPTLVFFNACEAARVRGRRRRKTRESRNARERINRNVGLAEAFLRGGVANYVGTYWPVGDVAAKEFSEVFYDNLLNGQSIGASLAAGRARLRQRRLLDWADYVHYGSPGFVLKSPG